MTLRLTGDEQDALRTRARAEGVWMQGVGRRALREHLDRSDPRDRVAAAADLILDVHADAIERLGR